jgi:hypothetical protein
MADRVTPDQVAGELEYTIPEHSGDVFIAPPLEDVGPLLSAARGADWSGAGILDVPLDEFRRLVRARALDLASRMSERRSAGSRGGEQRTTTGPDRPLIVMGHQPLFFHPGVWLKYFLLTRIAVDHEAAGLHVIVDTDAPGAIVAEVPAMRDRPVRVTETLVDPPAGVPLEAIPVPDAGTWEAFAGRLRAHLATLPSREPLDQWNAFAAGAEAASGTARSAAEFLAHLRREDEARAGPPGYLEIPMSALADTPEFRAFTLHLLAAPDELFRAYNGSLEAYRRAKRLRSAANPFPNLAMSGGRYETPFWVIRDGRRTDLFVARDAGRLVLATDTGPLAEVPSGSSGVAALAEAGIALRPKAMALTLFVRLCMADLFIHGVGGGRYDRVTDAIALQLFGRRPAAYVVATATLHLAVDAGTGAGRDRPTIERRVMDLRHNPDRHLETLSEDQRQWVDEKWTLIRALERMRPGRDRRAATRRIREINERLAGALAPEIARLEGRLAALRGDKGTGDVPFYRGFPYALFDPAEVRGLVPRPAQSA